MSDAPVPPSPLASSAPPLPGGIGAPAGRALARAGVATLADLARLREQQVAALHGVGPKAVARLREALAEHGLAFAASD